jgi:SAM-dependent methyltransferase
VALVPATSSSRGRVWEIARRLGGALRRYAHPLGPPLTYAAVNGRIHREDDMKHPDDADASHYASVGRSAVAAIGRGLAAAGRDFGDVQACLDMPCGYGRVLRALAQEIPGERVTACDINRRAIGFCASEFGATPLRSTPGLDHLRFGRYDLIWCGSLVTHIDERRVEQLLRGFAGALVPGGVAILTIHAEPPSSGQFAPLRDEIAAALGERGEFHVAYDGALFDYGHAWHTADYIRGVFAAVSGDEVELVSHETRGWDDHQDVLAFQRRR